MNKEKFSTIFAAVLVFVTVFALSGCHNADETATKVDEEVISTVKNAHEKAINILKDNMEKLHELAAYLLEKETITGDEFMNILNK